MLPLLLLIAFLAIGQDLHSGFTVKAGQVCNWVQFDLTQITGEKCMPYTKYIPATSASDCQSQCLAQGCVAVDVDNTNNGCYLLIKPSDGTSTTSITHYEYVCQNDPCQPNPCKNGGTCTGGADAVSYTCGCTALWSGLICDTPKISSVVSGGQPPKGPPLADTADPCSAAPCLNGGSCSAGSDVTQFVCACASGWTGTNCQTQCSGPFVMTMVVDDSFALYADGKKVPNLSNTKYWVPVDVSLNCVKVLAIWAYNNYYIGGIMVTTLDLWLVTNSTWKCTNKKSTGWQLPGYDDTNWPAALEIPYEDKPNFIWAAAAFHNGKADAPADVYCRKRLV